ncbi:MAG: hypothetical protein IH594_10305, partial [Bacteroidales bacterium]|nr:hypothetical protein [Bacteroidales bacterium]
MKRSLTGEEWDSSKYAVEEVERDMNHSKSATNTLQSDAGELPLEILGITVVPHYVSGEIPGYSDDQGYDKPGAHIRIFIKNNDPEAIDPVVLFNGKSGSQLFNEGIVSYCDVPEIRSVNKISHEIPGGGIDYYILNVMDSSFYSSGISLSVTDKKTERTLNKQLTIKNPECYATRIAFSSTQNKVFPDGFYIYFKNDSEKAARIDQIKIWSASNYYNKHYWLESFDPSGVGWFGLEGEIAPGDLNGAHVTTGQLPFGELIVEVNFSIDDIPNKLFYPMKAMVIGYDMGMGWAVSYLTKSDAYCKTMAYMHLNTVNGGGMNDFYADQERAEKYPMKMFARLPEFSRTSNSISIQRIHGEESLGEPQFSKTPAQEIFNYYTLFRHSGFPSTVSLTHEPGFNAYAGVVDFNHFDSYRIVAPHADKWGDYYKYGDKNVRWGAPLETIGFYMRTLNRISYPNRVAAWTQAVSNAWSSFVRVDYPNDLEVRIQAYEAVANGATSLYWFTLSGKNIKNHRFSLAEIQRINREI